jgi:hypothetical protein
LVTVLVFSAVSSQVAGIPFSFLVRLSWRTGGALLRRVVAFTGSSLEVAKWSLDLLR